MKVKRNTRLRTSILQENLSEIGKIKIITIEINLNADRKRFWLGKIDSIESRMLNESVPILLNHFKKGQI
ncbi:MAG TPA: hypothetical protein VNK44_07655 [Candidatus Nitrosotenuis sp.]|nr:hypothetical protein [Candidatus Nitrosotenuis sp.]